MSNSVTIKIISSLEKLYHEDKVPEIALSQFSMLNNEKKSFQIVIESEKDFIGTLSINSNIKDIRKYTVEHIKSDFPMFKGSDDYFRYSKDGYYPDLLLPIENEINIVKGINVFWVEVNAGKEYIGNNDIKISDTEEDTIKYLKDNHIQYDNIYLRTPDKLDVCLKEKIDIFIDDKEKTLIPLSESGVRCIKIMSHEEGPSKFETVSCWKEIKDLLSEN